MKIINILHNIPRCICDSIKCAFLVTSTIATVTAFLGYSLKDLEINLYYRILMIIAMFIVIFIVTYLIIRCFYKSLDIQIRNTSIKICNGDIFSKKDDFSEQILRVIGCDTHFNTQIDDKVISKKSLHGKLVLEHGEEQEIKKAIIEKANELKLKKNSDGLYDFPLGTIIRYDSNKDGLTYLMLAMMDLNDKYEAHSNMATFEAMLINMWKEISSVHAGYDVALPLLGSGISRFDDGSRSDNELLRSLLCTLDISGVTFNKSQVYIVIYNNSTIANLYEYKDILRTIPRR